MCSDISRLVACLGFALLLAHANFAGAVEPDRELFAAVQDANRVLIERLTKSIHVALSCKVDDFQGKTATYFKGDWIQQGQKIRSKTQIDAPPSLPASAKKDKSRVLVEYDYCSNDLNRTILERLRKTELPGPTEVQKDASISKSMPKAKPILNPWYSLGLLSDQESNIWIPDLLAKTGDLKTCKRISENGRDLVLVEKQCDKMFVQIWFEPGREYYPVRRREFYKATGQNTNGFFMEWQMIEFFKPTNTDNPPVPSKALRKVFHKEEKVTTHSDVNVDSVTFNPHTDASTFDLNIPAGYMVSDTIADRLYKSGNNGEPVSEKHLRKLSELDSEPIRLPAPPDKIDRPFPYFWFGCSVALVLFAIVFYLRRRQQLSAS